jgi:hypothetical protein
MLEQAIIENTAAVKALTEMLAKAGLVAANAAVAAAPVEDKKPAKKTTAPAATESAVTATTAETPVVQEKKAEISEPESVTTPPASAPLTKEERSVVMKRVMTAVGRDAVVALLAKYGAAKAGEIEESRLADFDAELVKLDA